MDINIIHQDLTNAKIKEVKKQGNLKSENEKGLKDACKGFESIFLNFMMESMTKTVPKDDLFGDGNGMDIYKSMYNQYLTENIAENGNGIGLGQFFYKEISKSK